VKANKAGHVTENILADILRAVGLEFQRQVHVGQSIYEPYHLRADFVVTNLAAFPLGLAIESKWQDRSGSVDEKFPFMAMNIRTRYTVPAIVVVAGGSCRQGALDWFRSQCDGHHLIAVVGMDEFISWAMRSEKV
jgi:hypothetical protein